MIITAISSVVARAAKGRVIANFGIQPIVDCIAPRSVRPCIAPQIVNASPARLDTIAAIAKRLIL